MDSSRTIEKCGSFGDDRRALPIIFRIPNAVKRTDSATLTDRAEFIALAIDPNPDAMTLRSYPPAQCDIAFFPFGLGN
jgi:hypothetical protein